MDSSTLSKKVTDFIKLEDGNVGRKSALVTGALLTSTLLGVMLASPASAGEHCDRWHWNHCHSNSPMYTDGYGCHSHYHENWDGPCYT